ncbi:MAG TPA: bifunctional phosphoribosylaminoimidazolecarboxamide formyltransferase/IMP cyclohydrolase [Armatimonadota bacterium]|nr:bifunctional phosphoribosylaminoimidazolecarboxamide formyltransferase/IMP cyclohydrolase [Armatimonadota bacterium]
MPRIKQALISVSDKSGVVEFAKALAEMGVEIISTGGTAKALSDAGIKVTGISEVTGFPEMMEGRVKTLHPAVHGGLLADRSKPDHMRQMEEHGIKPIDLVAVNLYPFAQTVAKPDVTLEDAIENIDIGGPSMVRSASKNFASVTIVVDPGDYGAVLQEMRENEGETTYETRAGLAAKAFTHTAAYDTMISGYLRRRFMPAEEFPRLIDLRFEKVQELRYGENPHQKGAFYKTPGYSGPGIASAKQLSGKELSFNNIWDANAALELVKEFDEPACVIIKHANPCGAAVADDLSQAYLRALEGDPVSAFGGIIAFSGALTAKVAETIMGGQAFYEVIIAPRFESDAIPVLTERKKWGANLRLLEVGDLKRPEAVAGIESKDMKKVTGGLLVQDRDVSELSRSDLRKVTERTPTDAQIEDLLFAWKVVRHVKSNAIVIAKGKQVLGVGAGQMNRVNSVRLAVARAGDKAKGAVLASDAFFPFPDGPQEAGEAGVAAIIQPGGSVKDQEVVDTANRYGMAMVFTGVRHFRH